jgi:hypothetical protein
MHPLVLDAAAVAKLELNIDNDFFVFFQTLMMTAKKCVRKTNQF